MFHRRDFEHYNAVTIQSRLTMSLKLFLFLNKHQGSLLSSVGFIIRFLTHVLVSVPKCSRIVNKARVVMGVPHVNRSTSESAQAWVAQKNISLKKYIQKTDFCSFSQFFPQHNIKRREYTCLLELIIDQNNIRPHLTYRQEDLTEFLYF